MYGHLLFYVNTYSISQKRQQECISSIEAYDNKKIVMIANIRSSNAVNMVNKI